MDDVAGQHTSAAWQHFIVILQKELFFRYTADQY
jgi:hypothetical protein